MPTIREEQMTGYGHCPDPRCDPYQHETQVVRRTTEYSFVDSGGDFPGLERSTVALAPAADAKSTCDGCGKSLELSVGERVEYPNESGVDPKGLLGLQPVVGDPNIAATVRAAEQDSAIADLQAKLAALTDQLTAPKA